MFFVLHKHTDDGGFDDFPKISEDFPFPNIFREFPKIAEDFRRRPEHVSMIHHRI